MCEQSEYILNVKAIKVKRRLKDYISHNSKSSASTVYVFYSKWSEYKKSPVIQGSTGLSGQGWSNQDSSVALKAGVL